MTFNPATALACAQTIHALYTNDIGPNVMAKATDTEALVEKISSPSLVGIHFPGTASFQDLLTDIKVRKVKSGAGRLHRGFQAAAESVCQQILSQLQAVFPEAPRVIISGHSLGGAVATITADWLNRCGYEVQAVYTFGSPRVANGPWQRDYNRRLGNRTYRIVNSGDPIPRIPWMLGTYRHVDQLVYLKKDGGIETNFAVAAAREAVSQLTTQGSQLSSKFVRPSAHHITSYIAQLERLDWKT